MYYLPSNLINQNYKYSINNYYYTVRTNNNCYTNYNTTYCDCYDVYFNNDYLTTNAYSCNYNTTTNVDYSNFSSEFWYKNNIQDSFFIFLILAIFIIYIPYRIFCKFLGRWLSL